MKLVMGLLIILAILSPIVGLLKNDLDLSSLAFTTDVKATSKTMEPLNQIQEKSEELKQTQSSLMKEQTEKSIQQMMKQHVNQRFPVEVIEAKVTTHVTPDQITEIKQVELVAKQKEHLQERNSDEARQVQMMEPVQIDVSISETAHPATTRPDAKQTTRQKELTAQIIDYLQQTWHLNLEQIQVRVETAL